MEIHEARKEAGTQECCSVFKKVVQECVTKKVAPGRGEPDFRGNSSTKTLRKEHARGFKEH